MWYSEGTVAVTNGGTELVGSGTKFWDNIRAGDGISVEGSSSLHQVVNVLSQTMLEINPPYSGASGSGKQWSAVPVLGYDKDLSDAFNQLRLQFSEQLTSLQPWALADTPLLARNALGASPSGNTVFTKTPAEGRAALGVGSYQNNLDAEQAPGADDDSTEGYSPLSVWIYDGTIYRCVDASPGAAVWVESSISESDLGSAAFAAIVDFDPVGSAQASTDYSIQRANHTGTQPIDTVEGLSPALVSVRIFDSAAEGRAEVLNDQYYYTKSDDPGVSKTLWQRISSSESRFVADDPSAELIYGALIAASSAGVSGEFPDDSGFSPLYAVADDDGSTLFYVDENGEFRSKPLFEFPADDSEEIYAIVDEDGRILLSFDENGELMQGTGGAVSSGREAMMPYPYEGTLRGSGDDDYHIADLGQYNSLSIHQGGPRSVRAVIDRPSIGPTTAVTGFVDGDVLVPDNPNVLHIVIGLGQSLMVGLRSENTLITTEQPYPNDVYMFDVGLNSDVRMGAEGGDWALNGSTIRGLRPLVAVSNGSSGQTPLESMGTALARYCRESDNVQTRRLFFVAARGGQPYDNLRKGTTVYTNMVTALQRAKEVAESEGWRVVVDCVVLRHGEAGSPAPESSYKNTLLQWQSDVDADVKAITGQQHDVPFLICQQSSHFGTTRSPITAMAELHAENPLFSVVAPDYPILDLYDTDLLHGLGGFYFINGEYLERAFRQTVWGNGSKNKITRMLSASRSGTTVDLEYEVPVAPLVFDSSISERDFRGFRYLDSAGDVTIIGADVIDSGSDGVGVVRLTLGSTPSGTDERVRYAMTGHSGTRELSTVPRGQLRDSAGNDERSRFDNRPLHNWAIHQSVEVMV